MTARLSTATSDFDPYRRLSADFVRPAIDRTIDLGQYVLAGSLGRDEDFGFETLVEDAGRIKPE